MEYVCMFKLNKTYWGENTFGLYLHFNLSPMTT